MRVGPRGASSLRARVSDSSSVCRLARASRSSAVSMRRAVAPRSASACWNSTSLLSKPRAMGNDYSILQRCKARTTSTRRLARHGARRARLEDSLSLSPGPLEQPIGTFRAIARRAAAGLFEPRSVGLEQRRGGAAEDRQPARLADLAGADGRMRSGALRTFADSRQARAVHRRGPARHGRIEPRARGAARGPRRRAGWPRFRMLDSTDPAAVRSVTTPPDADAVHPREQVGNDHRAEFAGRALPAVSSSVRVSAAGRITSSPSPTKAPSSRRARGPNGSATSSSTRPTSAAATRRCRSSGSCPRR